MLLLDLKHSGKLCEDLIIRGSNDGSNGNMWFHSGSSFIAAAGMLHIMMSFPLAFCLYRFVFGITPVYVLSFLSIYIILAIGADDVFVFIDAWRQSARAGPAVNENILTRMSYAYKRSAKAMAITSATTFGAFVATATSPLGAIFHYFSLFPIILSLLSSFCHFFHHFSHHFVTCSIILSSQVRLRRSVSSPRCSLRPTTSLSSHTSRPCSSYTT